MDLIRTEEVTKRYGNYVALDNINISVPKGSIFGLLGPNGAGKTTLIRIINQIIAPDKGKVFFNGQVLQPNHTDKIGYLPEERGLYKKMKASEQAIYLARLKGVSQHEAVSRLKYWFRKFEILSWWDRKVEELSKGMQQKIQFIVTILHQPELLIFDEPFSGFDPINVDLIKNEILKLRDEGASIIFSTHSMESVEQLCDNIALIHQSKVVLSGAVNEIKSRFSQNLFEVESYKADLSTITPNLPQGIHYQKTEPNSSLYKHYFKLDASLAPNDLLASLLPYMQITGFRELLPSMHDIFVSTIQNGSLPANPS
ncbi:MAG TPA: ABC transporter ATP-binding protein [Bacteroidales bacterium]|jgi:ABC-2 type transport system ATP-binding protein|nr:ATP-binding cassette domain-containing protein [Bacteroidales bacterium]MDI9573016.1 ABC transporter ATP-binding protein [Bacteroidota bacterium]OQC60050.1 MAG: Daunorubicin/doxorubicin resistance ATP-binding protein DrrA [Bacteroidetes bacterium ADurb.Bin012]MBP9511748.1 ATP-binding cassette domain-containing protein [Bacteroidales bacterium]MBP9588517.1 ATP-binding cassette domain-containing protein [Bacteroidales bacterium]